MDMRFVAATLLFALSLSADDFPLLPADRVPAAEGQSNPDVASNGSELMAVWHDDRAYLNTPALYAARIRADGTPIDELGIRLDSAVHSYAPHVAADGSDFVVAYTAGSRSYFTRIEDGRVTHRAPLPARRYETVVDLETNGRSFCTLVSSWNGWNGADAIFTDGFGRVQSVVRLPRETERLVAAGDSYWAAVQHWESGRTRLLRVTPAGVDKTVDLPVFGESMAMHAGSDRLLVAWTSLLGWQVRVEYAVVHADGYLAGSGTFIGQQPFETILLSPPRIGWDGIHFLVAWTGVFAMLGAPPSTAAVRVRPDGTVADAAALQLAAQLVQLATARHGATTMIVAAQTAKYAEELELVAYPVSSFPETLPAAGNIIAWSASRQRDASVAAIGDVALAVFSEGSWPNRVAASLLAPNRPPRRVELTTMDRSTAKKGGVAASREQFLVAWAEQTPTVFSSNDSVVRARRIGPDGVPRETEPIEVAPLRRSFGAGKPAVASDGTDFFIAWQAGSNPFAVHGALVRADGSTRPVLPLTDRVDNLARESVRVIWTGSVYAVIWREASRRDGNAWAVPLLMVRVSADGVKLDHSPVMLVDEPRAELQSMWIDATSDGEGRAVVTWATADCIRAIALGFDGKPLGAPRSIACNQQLHWLTSVAVTRTGSGYAMFWTTVSPERELRYTAVDRELDPLHPPRTLVRPGPAADKPAATFTGDSVLLIYDKSTDEGGAGGARRVFGRVLPKARF